MDGKFNMITCPAGLVFNPKTGICTWPDEAQKIGCSSEGEFIIHFLFFFFGVDLFNWLELNGDDFSHLKLSCSVPIPSI